MKNVKPKVGLDNRKILTPRQKEVLDCIKNEILEKGYPPSVRDLCERCGFASTSTVFNHLNTLEKKGYIRRNEYKSRAIEIVDGDANFNRVEMQNVPIVGNVAAGLPLLAVENIENYFPIPMEYMPNEKCFMLRVKGESMINAGILDGDMILVKETQTASNGEMIVALIDDSATVKTFYKEADHIRLQPENDHMDPIIVDDCMILGKVIGVFRFF